MTFLKNRYQSKCIRTPVSRPIEGLLKNIVLSSGRTNTGHLALFHRGGGLSRRYRLVDFKRSLWNLASVVLYNEYDPNRTSLVSLICFYNGVLCYFITTEGIGPGDILFSGSRYRFVNYGNFLPLILIPEGTLIHSLEIRPSVGAQIIRAAGTFAVLVKKFFRFRKILLRLPSKEEVLVDQNLMATMGQVSRTHHKIERIYKAGWSRLRGFRPVVRGVAKNPVDHPHGGGGGKCKVTPWARPAKKVSTRLVGGFNFFLIVKSRKKRR
jgi:large subunit ribosomal protein L2